MSDREIVLLTPEDWEAFRDIRLRALADSPSAFSTTLADAQRLDMTAWRMRIADCARWLARLDGRDAGTVGAYRDGDGIDLVAMWVDPTARRRGLGGALVDAVVRHARDQGCKDVALHVTVGNADAERLYARHGFVATGVVAPMSDAPGARLEAELVRCLDACDVARRFNAAINARDIDRLVALMTDDHRFVDSAGTTFEGRARGREIWAQFFAAFSDYQNYFASVDEIADGVVAMTGRSTCSVPSLAGAALWTATIRDGRVAEWRVYDDRPKIREKIGITA